MSVSYEIDQPRYFVYTRLYGRVDFEQCVTHHRILGEDADFESGMFELIDASDVEHISLAYPTIRELIKSSPFGPESRRAICTGGNLFHYGLARMFQIVFSDSHGEIKIFKEHAEAMAWLQLEENL